MAAPIQKDISRLESGPWTPASEKRLLGRRDQDAPSSSGHPLSFTEKMPSARRLLLVLSVSLLVALGVATAVSPARWVQQPGEEDVTNQEGQSGPADDAASFAALVDNVSPESLRHLLHKYLPTRFKPGVWPSERSAIEAVHRDDADLATSIAQLARRDNTTSTTTTTSTPPTTTPSPTTTSTTSSTSLPQVTTPSVTPTTTSNTQTSSTGSTVSSSSTVITSTTSSSTPSTTTPGTSTSPSSSVPVTSQPTSSVVSPPPSSSSSSSASVTPSPTVQTSSSRGGSTLTTSSVTSTTSSSGSLEATTMTYTSTDSTGGLVIVTQTSYVNPSASQTGATSTTRPGTLHTNAAVAPYQRNDVLQVMVGGVIVGGVLLV